jgi:hypothetical protein
MSRERELRKWIKQMREAVERGRAIGVGKVDVAKKVCGVFLASVVGEA